MKDEDDAGVAGGLRGLDAHGAVPKRHARDMQAQEILNRLLEIGSRLSQPDPGKVLDLLLKDHNAYVCNMDDCRHFDDIIRLDFERMAWATRAKAYRSLLDLALPHVERGVRESVDRLAKLADEHGVEVLLDYAKLDASAADSGEGNA